jgi:hypothetical protein
MGGPEVLSVAIASLMMSHFGMWRPTDGRKLNDAHVSIRDIYADDWTLPEFECHTNPLRQASTKLNELLSRLNGRMGCPGENAVYELGERA